MHKGFLKTSAIFAMLAVALGAFAAHSLKGTISDHALNTFDTAVRYQFYHAFALLATGIVYRDFRWSPALWAGRFFIIGIILFSGSLYGMAVSQATVQPGYGWIGIITPIGGLFFIAGWILLFISYFKKN